MVTYDVRKFLKGKVSEGFTATSVATSLDELELSNDEISVDVNTEASRGGELRT